MVKTTQCKYVFLEKDTNLNGERDAKYKRLISYLNPMFKMQSPVYKFLGLD